MVDELHAMNTRLMLSVWSKIDPQSEVGKEMMQKGYYIDQTSWIDFLIRMLRLVIGVISVTVY